MRRKKGKERQRFDELTQQGQIAARQTAEECIREVCAVEGIKPERANTLSKLYGTGKLARELTGKLTS